jgi:phosphoribosylaminoimidazole (AIR) synthetase
LARRTFNARTLSDIGSFGGMFDGAFPAMRQPVLVASADGVGTKLKVAFETGVHNTVGRDSRQSLRQRTSWCRARARSSSSIISPRES